MQFPYHTIREGHSCFPRPLCLAGKNFSSGVRVHCLAPGGVDLTSAAGKITMSVINAVAEFKPNLLVERTQAGLKRAKAQGKHWAGHRD
jgi:hypothetical protein